MGTGSKRRFTIDRYRDGKSVVLDTAEGEEAAISAFRRAIEGVTDAKDIWIRQENNERHRQDLEKKARDLIEPDSSDIPNIPEDLLTYLRKLREEEPPDTDISSEKLSLLTKKLIEYLSQATSSEQFSAMADRFSDELLYCDEFDDSEVGSCEWFHARMQFVYQRALELIILRGKGAENQGKER